MPETKDKTLEEIDLLFERPTREIVAENVKNTVQSCGNFFMGRWGSSAQPTRELDIDEKNDKDIKV